MTNQNNNRCAGRLKLESRGRAEKAMNFVQTERSRSRRPPWLRPKAIRCWRRKQKQCGQPEHREKLRRRCFQPLAAYPQLRSGCRIDRSRMRRLIKRKLCVDREGKHTHHKRHHKKSAATGVLRVCPHSGGQCYTKLAQLSKTERLSRARCCKPKFRDQRLDALLWFIVTSRRGRVYLRK